MRHRCGVDVCPRELPYAAKRPLAPFCPSPPMHYLAGRLLNNMHPDRGHDGVCPMPNEFQEAFRHAFISWSAPTQTILRSSILQNILPSIPPVEISDFSVTAERQPQIGVRLVCKTTSDTACTAPVKVTTGGLRFGQRNPSVSHSIMENFDAAIPQHKHLTGLVSAWLYLLSLRLLNHLERAGFDVRMEQAASCRQEFWDMAKPSNWFATFQVNGEMYYTPWSSAASAGCHL